VEKRIVTALVRSAAPPKHMPGLSLTRDPLGGEGALSASSGERPSAGAARDHTSDIGKKAAQA